MADSITVSKTKKTPSAKTVEMRVDYINSSLPLFDLTVAAKAPKEVKSSIDKHFKDFTANIKPPMPKPPMDRSKSPILGYDAIRKASLREAEHNYEKSCRSALTTLKVAMGVWETALSDHEFANTNAMAIAETSAEEAVADYRSNINDDSKSREMYIYESMAVTVGTAIETYESFLEPVASTLAIAAGTMVIAQITYLNVVRKAATTCLTAMHTAEQTFWQSVEVVLD